MNKVLLTLTFLFLGTSSAIAVDLINGDGRSYEIRVIYNGQSKDTSIDATTAIENICSTSCRIEVKGVGSINANPNDIVVIEDRTLRKK